jgi:hypothetical protein
MRPTALMMFSGLSLASIAACAPVPGNTYPQSALATTCDQMEGYPDCTSGHETTMTLQALQGPARSSQGLQASAHSS